jgi:hypothetical protein
MFSGWLVLKNHTNFGCAANLATLDGTIIYNYPIHRYSGEHGISHTLNSYYLNFIKIRYWRHFHNSLGETSVMITYVMIDYNDNTA